MSPKNFVTVVLVGSGEAYVGDRPDPNSFSLTNTVHIGSTYGRNSVLRAWSDRVSNKGDIDLEPIFDIADATFELVNTGIVEDVRKAFADSDTEGLLYDFLLTFWSESDGSPD